MLAARYRGGENLQRPIPAQSSQVLLNSFRVPRRFPSIMARMEKPTYRTTFMFVTVMLLGMAIGWIAMLVLMLKRY